MSRTSPLPMVIGLPWECSATATSSALPLTRQTSLSDGFPMLAGGRL